jgi:AraC-like DNA-binding protein
VTADVYVSGGLVGLLLSYLDACGLDAPALRADLGPHAASPRMPITDWWALLERIARASPLAAPGLRIGAHVKVHHLGVLGYLAASCDTLGQALQRFQRFQPLLHNLSPTLVTAQADVLRVGWDPAYGQSTQLSNDVLVAGLIRIIRALTGQDAFTPLQVDFPGAEPADAGVYASLLGCPVRFGAQVLLVHLSPAVLDLPINGRDPHLHAVLDQQAEALLQASPQPDNFLTGLQRLIAEALRDGEPSLEQVARRMGVPARTIHRRLQARNLTYKGLLNQLRFQLARRYLAERRWSLPEIALRLGYSEQSAFTRAFKGWCGQTPLHYRKTHAGDVA